MSITTNATLRRGTSWIINGLARDENGEPLDITNGTVSLRLATESPNAVALDLLAPGDGSIVNGPAGQYQFVITPDDQLSSLPLTAYRYEVRILLNDGSLTDQNTGDIEILDSLFVNFP